MSKFQAHKDAPDEVWLQIGYGDEGEHTWAPHEIAEDGIEEAGPYVRADRLSGRVTAEDYRDLQSRLATARNDSLEEAAKIADGYHEAAIKWAATYVKQFDGETDSKRIAAAIRALKSETKP